MRTRSALKSLMTTVPALLAVFIAAALLAGCASHAPSLGKNPTQDAGLFYGQGQNAQEKGDYKAAKVAYTKAVRAGSPEGAMALVSLYDNGYIEGVSEKEHGSAVVKLAQDSAAAGYVPAMYYLAELYKDGRFVEKDASKATEWLTRAAENGDTSAMLTLAEGYRKLCCSCGLVCTCAPECPAKAALWPVEQDMEKALYWYKRAAEKGETYAACVLGEIYSEGVETKLDYKEAVKWYTLGLGKGNGTAENNLANMYLVGQGVPKDYAKATELYTQAMDRGVKNTAEHNMAELKLYAPPPFRNHKEAVPVIVNAAKNGDTYSQVLLGEMYETGRGVKRDYKEAAKWYASAIEDGRAEAMVALGEMYRTGRGVPVDYPQAKSYFERAVEYHNAWGYRGLGKLYCLGQGVPRDETQGMNYYLQGAENGDQEAMFLLAEGLERGGDMQSARKWYQAAADYTINQLPRASYTRDFDVEPIAAKARAALRRLGG